MKNEFKDEDYQELYEQSSKEIVNYNLDETNEIMNDPSKFEIFMNKVEDKIKKFPGVGNTLADLVTMIALVRCYVMKEYTDVSLAKIIMIIATLIYWVSPVDLIPEEILGIGMIDDIALLGFTANVVKDDLEAFREWREGE